MRQPSKSAVLIAGHLGCILALAASLILLHGAKGASATAFLPMAAQFVYPVGNPDIMPGYSSGNGYSITQGFNTSCDPSAHQGEYYGGYYFCGHTGVDLGDASYGGEVRATAAGQIVFAGPDGNYGNMVRIEHLLPAGNIVYSQYEHLDSINIWDGEIVTCGQQIGSVGASGFALGPHLHFEIKDSDSDGPGYTFGNAALLAGFYDPLAFVAARMAAPLPTPVPTATAVLPSLPTAQPATTSTGNSENAAILAHFLQRYHNFVTVNIPALRLRSGPDLQAKQLSTVTQHAKLALLGVEGLWLHVALPGNLSGWVYSSYVKGTIPASMRTSVQSKPGVAQSNHNATSRTVVAAFKATATAKTKRPADIHRLGPLAEVIGDGVHVRQGPRLSENVLFLAYHGSMVAVRAIHVSWAQVTFTNGATGWIMRHYLRMPDELNPKKVVAKRASPVRPADIHRLGPLAEVIGDGVHVRQGPRLSENVLFLAYHGSMVAVRAIHVSWAQVTFTNGATGWIMRHYLRVFPVVVSAAKTTPNRGTPASLTVRETTTITHTAQVGHAHGQSAASTKAVASRPTITTRKSLPVYYTWATTLYVRDAPRLSGTVIALAGQNTHVRVLGTSVSWSHVQLPDGKVGWVLTHYIKDHLQI